MRFFVLFFIVATGLMAVDIDFNHPAQGDVLSSMYEYVRTNEVYSLKMDTSITASNKPTGTMAFDKTNYYLTQWNGSAFADFNLKFKNGTVINESGADSDTRIEGDTDVNLFYVDAGNNRIGIGTSTPGYNLSITGSATNERTTCLHTASNNLGTAAGIRFNTAGSSDILYGKGGLFYVLTGTSGRGEFRFCQDEVADSGNVLTSEVVLTIQNDGDVGIGTNTPGAPLEVNGATILDSLTASGTIALDGGTFTYNNSQANLDFRFAGDNEANLLYGDAGNDRVGIGTATPSRRFDVEYNEGAGNAKGIQMTNTAAGGNSWGLAISATGDTNASAGSLYLRDDTSGGTKLEIKTSGVIVFTGDVYNVAWTDYGGTSTVTGWAATPTKHIYYKKIGNLVWVNFSISGTSNGTSSYFTLPYTAVDDGMYFHGSMGNAQDNGVTLTVATKYWLAPNTNVVYCFTNMNNGTWTASGTKTCAGQFWYEAQ